MPIDSMEWHQGHDFPADLDADAAGTHIGMFLTWVILNDLIHDDLQDDNADSLDAVHSRILTGRGYLIQACGGNLTNADLDEDTQLFAKEYYSADGDGTSHYLEDYERTLAVGLPSIYHVQDVWDNYNLLAPVIDAAHSRWRVKQA